jgi:hypothetical protein
MSNPNKTLSSLIQYLDLPSLKFKLILVGLYSLGIYSLYLYKSDEFMIWIGEEDSLIEYLTAFFFISTSAMAIRMFIKTKVIWFGLLAIVFFVGFGEEISWGQRLFGYSTPETVNSQNIQGEFNLHNLEILDSKDFSGSEKSGWRKFTSVQFLFNLFWFSYGILVPLAFFFIAFLQNIMKKLKLPIPALAIGVCFLIDWLIFRVSKSFLLMPGKSPHYYFTMNEMFESCTALIFMVILWEFTVKKSAQPSS